MGQAIGDTFLDPSFPNVSESTLEDIKIRIYFLEAHRHFQLSIDLERQGFARSDSGNLSI